MSSLDVAIVGCGRMGTLRAGAVLRWGACVRAVFDTDEGRAAALAAALPGAAAAPLHAGVRWRDFDAVLVCTPPAARDCAGAALAQGVATFLEKPVGLHADAAGVLLHAARRSGAITAVGYMNRYRETVQHARERVRRESVLGASAHWVNGTYAVPWWSQTGQSGGSLNEQATHLVDLYRYLIGEPTAVQVAASPHPDHPQLTGTAALTLSFADGVLATLLYSCRAQAKAIGLRLFFAQGETALQDWDFRPAGGEATAPPSVPAGRNQIFDTETGAFLDAVASGDPGGIRCDIADALRTQRVLDAVARAQATGSPCTVGATEWS